MYSSEKSSLAVGLSPYKIEKKDAFARASFFTILHGLQRSQILRKKLALTP